jgi:hypothetical protein
MGREPIKVANLADDKRLIESDLRLFSPWRDRGPRLVFRGPDAEIHDEWEVVPEATWTYWLARYGGYRSSDHSN